MIIIIIMYMCTASIKEAQLPLGEDHSKKYSSSSYYRSNRGKVKVGFFISCHKFKTQIINIKSSISNHQYQIVNIKSSISNHQYEIINIAPKGNPGRKLVTAYCTKRWQICDTLVGHTVTVVGHSHSGGTHSHSCVSGMHLNGYSKQPIPLNYNDPIFW